MDKVTLKRNIQNDYTIRYYTVSGGQFNAMVEAIKALPFRQFDGNDKAWAVNGDGIKTLKAHGFTVTQDPDLKHEFVPDSISERDGEIRVTIYSAFREDKIFFKSMPSKIIYFTVTDDEVEAEKIRINSVAKEYGMNVAPADRHQAVREIARRKCNEYFASLVEVYETTVGGKRDKNSVMAGLKAVIEMTK